MELLLDIGVFIFYHDNLLLYVDFRQVKGLDSKMTTKMVRKNGVIL